VNDAVALCPKFLFKFLIEKSDLSLKWIVWYVLFTWFGLYILLLFTCL